MNKKFKPFYIKVMNCTCSKSECPQSKKDFKSGWAPPRGFNPCKSNTTKILVVGKNPGHPFDEEIPFYKGKRGENLLKAKEEWDSFKYTMLRSKKKDRSLKYHMNLRRYLRYFLGLSKKLETYKEYQTNWKPDHEKEISEHVAFTNLFKCSTKCEQERIKDTSFENCYEKYFKEEIELIRPQIIFALGSEVTKFLKSKKLDVPLISIRHPSYFYKKNDELKKLKNKKTALKNALNI
jgi:uracil-DNA glycosylase